MVPSTLGGLLERPAAREQDLTRRPYAGNGNRDRTHKRMTIPQGIPMDFAWSRLSAGHLRNRREHSAPQSRWAHFKNGGWFLSDRRGQEIAETIPFDDEHELNVQRAYRFVCRMVEGTIPRAL